MTDSVEVVSTVEVTVVEQSVDQTEIYLAGDETEVLIVGDETIIESVESISHVIHEATVVNMGGGSSQGNSFFPSGW